MKKIAPWLLIALVTFSLVLRLFLSFESPYFDNIAYSQIRQIEHIQETFIPLYEDSSAYGGRTLVFPPLFHYMMAGFDTLFPLKYSLKYFPNLLASLTVILVYFIAWELTKKESSSLFAAFVSATVPIFLSETVNAVSPATLSIPLLFTTIYLFMVSGKSKARAIAFIVSFMLLVVSSPLSLLVIVFLLVYLLLVKLERLRIFKSEIELTLFSSFLALWLYFLIYKKAIIAHGIGLLFQNIPRSMAVILSDINPVSVLVLVGLLPIIMGVFIIHQHIFVEKKKPFYLIISIIISSSILTWLHLMPVKSGLIVLGISLSILSADYYSRFIDYISKSKFSSFHPLFTLLLIVIILITSFAPAYYMTAIRTEQVVTKDDISAILWLKYNTNKDSIIAVSLPEGSLVEYGSGRAVVADMQFIGVDHPEQTYKDLVNLYRTPFSTPAVRIADKYGITHILVTDTTRAFFNITDLLYGDSRCFKTVYNGYEKVKIYSVECTFEGAS